MLLRFFLSSKTSGRLLNLDDTVDRTDLNACRLVMPADAVNTGLFINDIGVVAGRNCLDRTLWFTCSAVGACIRDSMCHFYFPV